MFSKEEILAMSGGEKEPEKKDESKREELEKLAEETLDKLEKIGDVEEFIDVLQTLTKSLVLVL